MTLTEMNRKQVAIVVPVHAEKLTAEQSISLNQLNTCLKGYDKYVVLPKNLDVDWANFFTQKFDQSFFSSNQGYNKLMISKQFYQAFKNYEYILIYQLDSLVFSDQLLQWCERGYDYIGAPWFVDVIPEMNWSVQDCVGNGGFSLRKVGTFLKVLNRYYSHSYRLKESLIQSYRFVQKITAFIKKQILSGSKSNQKIDFLKKQSDIGQEDIFWSIKTRDLYPTFNIPPPEEAVSFSFEVNPQYCFQKNGYRLPFGCHAWTKYDLKFWETFMFNANSIQSHTANDYISSK